MRTPSLRSYSLFLRAWIFLTLCYCASALHAATFTWTVSSGGSASGSWATGTNWSPAGPPTAADAADFSKLDLTADSVVTLDGDQSITGLTFGDTNTLSGASWIINPGSVSTSTLILAGSTAALNTINVAYPTSFPFPLFSPAQAVTFNVGLSGTAGFAKTGTGLLILNGSSNLSGNVTIGGNGSNSGYQGAIRLTNNNALGTATFQQPAGGNNTLEPLELANNVTITNAGSGGGKDNGLPGIRSVSGTNNYAGTWTQTSTGGGSTFESASGFFNVSGTLTSTVGARVLNLSGASDGNLSALVTGSFNQFNKFGVGTWTLSGTSTLSVAIQLQAGTVILNGTTGSFGTMGPITFGGGTNIQGGAGSGATLNYLGNPAGSALSAGALTFTLGENVVQSTYGGSGTTSITFASLGTRSAGATGNFVNSGGSTGTPGTPGTNFIKFTTSPGTGFLNQGLFFSGSNYAFNDTVGGFVRGIAYGTDAGSQVAGSVTSVASASGSNVLITGPVTGQTTDTFLTLNISGSNDFTLAGGQTVTVNGILKGGNNAGAPVISGGTGLQASSGAELVLRADGANDSLTITTPILANGVNVLTKSGSGTVTLAGSNSYTGATIVDSGTLSITGVVTGTATTTVQAGGALTVSGTINPTAANDTGNLVVAAATGKAQAIINGGVVNAGNGNVTVGTQPGAVGLLVINSGTLSVNSAASQRNIEAGNGGQLGTPAFGAVRVNGGTVSIHGFLLAGAGAQGIGIWNLNGGTVSINGNFGGTLGATNASATANDIGVMNVTGGTFNSTDATANGLSGIYVGEGATGILNVSGSGAMNLGGASTSNGLVIGRNATGVGIVNLGGVGTGGGTITATRVQKANASATGILNFHGGTLRASSAALASLSGTFMGGLTNAYIYSEGATINNNGLDLLITQPLQAPTGNGVSSVSLTSSGTGFIATPLVTLVGGGGIGATAVANINAAGNITGITITNPGTGYTSAPSVQITGGGGTGAVVGTVNIAPNTGGALTVTGGTGSVTLTGNNTFTGNSAVQQGTLNVNATSTLGAFSIANGGTLNVTTSSSSTGITVAGGGGLGVTVSGSGQSFVIPTLTLGTTGTATVSLNTGGFGNPTTAIITTGTLTTNGSVKLAVGGSLTSGTFPLIDYSGSIGGAGFGAFSVNANSLPARSIANLINNTANTSVDIGITADNPKWRGNVNSDWDIQTTANWVLTSGSATTYFQSAVSGTDAVIFDDTATNTVVNLTTTLTPAGVTVTGTKNYTFTSFGKLSGATGLTKSGTGTLIIANTSVNDYTGATVINGGAIQIGSGNPGEGLSIGTGPVTDNGRLIFNYAPIGTETLTIANSIGGAGSLVKELAGSTVTLTGTNSYTGGLTINGGIVQVSAAANLGDPSSAIVINSGTLQTLANATITSGTGRTVTLGQATSELQVDSGATLTINGSVNGAGSLTKSGTGNLVLGGSNSFAGTTVTVNAGTLTLANNNALSGATQVNVSSTTGGAGLTGTRIALSGGITIPNTVTLSLPSAATGDIRSNLFSISGTNTWNGPITFSGVDGTIGFGGANGGSQLILGGNISAPSFGGAVILRGPGTGSSGVAGILNGILSVSPTATLQITDNVTWIIASSGNTWGPTVLVNASTLQIGNGGTTGTIGSGDISISNNSTIAYNRTDTLVLSNTIGVTTGTNGNVTVNSGTLVLNNSSNGYNGTTTINNGATLSTNALAVGGSNSGIGSSSNAAGSLAINGGTLRYTGAAVSTDRLFTAGTNGVTLDASGSGALSFVNTGTMGLTGSGARTITLTGANTGNNTLAASIRENGGATSVTKNGAGTWSLTGSNIYAGATTVNQGTLNLLTSSSIGSLTVAGGANFGVTVAGAGQGLQTTSFALGGSGTSSITFDLASFGSPTAAVIRTGSLTLSGPTRVNVAASSVLSVGQSALIGYTSLSGTFGNLSLASLPARVIGNLVDTGTSVNLNITSFDIPKWTGAVNNNWDIGTTATSGGTPNWVTATSGSATRYLQGVTTGTDSVLFDDSAGAAHSTVVLTTTTGTLMPVAVTASNNVVTYTFTGAGKLSGAASLTKTGSGTLILANTGSNDYTGTTVIGSGTLQLGNGSTSGAGSIGSGSVTDNGALILNRPDALSLGNVITGIGSVLQKLGLVSMTGANNYTGGTQIDGGVMQINTASSLGNQSGAAVINSGTLEALNTITTSRNFSLGSASSAIRVDAGTYTLTGILSDGTSAGTLNMFGPGILALNGVNTYTGGTVINSGTVQINNVSSLGSLSGPATIANAGTLEITTTNAITTTRNFNLTGTGGTIQVDTGGNYTINGTVSGLGLNKTGAGTLVLGGSNTLSGIINVGPGTGNPALTLASNNALGNASQVILSSTTGGASGGTRVQLTGGITTSPAATLSMPSTIVGDLRSALVSLAGGINTWSGGVTLNGDGNIAFISGGNAPLFVSGTVDGSNTFYTGSLQLRGNANAPVIVTGPITMPSATLVVTDAARAVVDGTGNSWLTANIASGILQIGRNDTKGDLGGTGAVTNAGTVAYNRTDALTLSNVISGAGGIAVNSGTMILIGANTYTGATAINNGTLLLDYSAPGAPTSGIINSTGTSSALQLLGGTLRITGSSGNAITQSFNGTTFAGDTFSAIRVAQGGATSLNVTLGALTRGSQATADFVLPTAGSLTTTSSLNSINTVLTTATDGVAYATVNGNTWATNTSGTIGALSTYATNNFGAATNNVDVTTSVDLSGSASGFTVNTLRFSGAGNTLTLASGTSAVNTGGVLVTPGSVATIASGTAGGAIRGANGSARELVLINNGQLNVSAPIADSPGGATALAVSGTGVTTISGSNTYTGSTTINAGRTNLTGSISSSTTSPVTVNNAVLNVQGGTLLANKTSAPSIQVGSAGSDNGTINLNSGTVTSANELWLGVSNVAGTTPFGAFILNGGTATFGSYVALGRGNTANGAGRGELIVNGGALTITANQLTIGSTQNTLENTNVATLNGGVTTLGTTASSGGSVFVGENANGILNVSGSATLNVLNTSQSVQLGVVGGVTGIVNLRTGGVISTPAVTKGSGSGIFNFNGGTLKAVTTGTLMSGLTNAYVYSGGALIDDGGNSITISQNLLAPTGNGIGAAGTTLAASGTGFTAPPIVEVTGGGGTGATAVANINASGVLTGITITNPGVNYTSAPAFSLFGGAGVGAVTGTATLAASTSGGLTKSGSGTLTFSGSSTYTGQTIVAAGRLVVSGSLSAGGSVVVGNASNLSASAALSGNGTVGNVTLGAAANNTGAVLSPSVGVTATGATLNTRNLAMNSGAHLALQLGRTSAGTDFASGISDRVNVTGSVSLNGDLQISLLSSYTPAVNDVFYLILNDGTDPITGAFTSVNGVATTLTQGSIFTFGANTYQISYNADSATSAFSAPGINGNDLALQVVAAVPEPGTWAMLFSGMGMLLALNRRKRK